jgi:hypothetical protein
LPNHYVRGRSGAYVTLPNHYVRGRSGAYVQLDHFVEGSSLPGSAQHRGLRRGRIQRSQYGFAQFVRRRRPGSQWNASHRPNDTIALGFATANDDPRLRNLELALQAVRYDVPYNGSEKPSSSISVGMHRTGSLFDATAIRFESERFGNHTPAGLVVPKNALVIGLGTYSSF